MAHRVRLMLLVLCSLNALLFSGGVLFGWAALEVVLEDDGIFPDLPKLARIATIQKMPSAAFVSISIAASASGITLDLIGPRVLSCIGTALAAIGNLIFAFTTDDNLYQWAFCLISVGGTANYLCGFNFAFLFPGLESVFISLACAALFCAAGLNYMFFKYLYLFHGVSLQQYFSVMGVLALCSCCMSWVFYPVFPYTPARKTPVRPPLCGCGRRCAKQKSRTRSLSMDTGTARLCHCGRSPTHYLSACRLRHQLLSPTFLWLLVLYPLSLLAMSFYNASIVTQLSSKDPMFNCVPSYTGPNPCPIGERPINTTALTAAAAACVPCLYRSYVDWFQLFSTLSFCLNPFAGVLLQRCGFALSLAVGVFCSQLAVGVLIVSSLRMQFLSFTAYALMRAIIFSAYFSLVAQSLPVHFYGTFIAVGDGVAAAVSLLQYPMLSLLSGENPMGARYVNAAVVAALSLCYGLPFTLACQRKPPAEATRYPEPATSEPLLPAFSMATEEGLK